MAISTIEWTTNSVPASGSLEQSLTGIGINEFNILRLEIEPSAGGGNSTYEFWKDNTFTGDEKLAFRTLPNAQSIYHEPVEIDASGNLFARGEGFVCVYEDLNAVGRLHVKIFNDAGVSRTYRIKIWYRAP